jgi:hypothetical protein
VCKFESNLIQHLVFSVAGLGANHRVLWRLPVDDTAAHRARQASGLSGPIAGQLLAVRHPVIVHTTDGRLPVGAFALEGDELGMSVSAVGHLIPPRTLRYRRDRGDDSLRRVAPTICDGASAGGCEADDEAAED